MTIALVILCAAVLATSAVLMVSIRRKEDPTGASEPPKRWRLVRQPGILHHVIFDSKTGKSPRYIEDRYNYWVPGYNWDLAEEFLDYLNAKEPPEFGSAEWAKLEAMKEIDKLTGEAS